MAGSLFGGLFAGIKQEAGSPGGLFSSSSRYAAPTLAAAAAAAAPDAGGSKKKRKKQAAAEAPAAAAAAAGAERAVKKERKEKPAKQQQRAAAAAAAAAVKVKKEQQQAAAPQPQPPSKQRSAAAEAALERKVKKVKKEPQEAAAEPQPLSKQRGPAAPAAAQAAAPAAKAGKTGKAADKAAGKAAAPAEAAAKPAGDAGKGKGGKAAAPADERLPRTVFVGNLPATVKRKALARLFTAAGCGAVDSVRLRSLPLKQEPESKIPRRGAIAAGKIDSEHSAHAYVVFDEEAAVEKALALNMSEFEGHHIRVDRAAPPAAKGAVAFDHTRSLFVGNVPHDCEDEELIRHFGAAAVEAVRVVRDGKTGAGKGVAFVLFRSQEASKAALRPKGSSELRGRKLRLTVVKKQAKADGKGAAWQQGKGGSGKGGGGKGGKPAAGKRKAGGKRPAVAARKAAAKLSAKGGVQKKRKGE